MMESDDSVQSRMSKTERMPLYIKGLEIVNLVNCVADLIDDKEHEFIKFQLKTDANVLTHNLMVAEMSKIYDVCMEHASQIRRAGYSLKQHVISLELIGFEYLEYYVLVLRKVEEYRLLFLDWIEQLGTYQYYIDVWGLFNPPGVVLPDEFRTMESDYNLNWRDEKDEDERANDGFDDDELDDEWF